MTKTQLRATAAKPGPRRTTAARGKGRQKSEHAVGPETILEAARKLLKRAAPGAITAADLSREAGVDPALIRYYFGDKASLMGIVIREYLSESALVRDAYQARGQGTLRDRLWTKVRSLIELSVENPQMHEIIVRGLILGPDGDSEIDDLRDRLVRQSFQDFQQIAADGVATGEFRPIDVRFLFVAYIGMGEFSVPGASLFKLLGGEPVSREDMLSGYADLVADMLYAALAGPKREVVDRHD